MFLDLKLMFKFSCSHVSIARQLHEQKICYLTLESCFRSIASSGDSHYLPRTSPHSIHTAWNSRIWNLEFRKTIEKSLKFVSCRGLDPCTRHKFIETGQHVKNMSGGNRCYYGQSAKVGDFHWEVKINLKGRLTRRREEYVGLIKSFFCFFLSFLGGEDPT